MRSGTPRRDCRAAPPRVPLRAWPCAGIRITNPSPGFCSPSPGAPGSSRCFEQFIAGVAWPILASIVRAISCRRFLARLCLGYFSRYRHFVPMSRGIDRYCPGLAVTTGVARFSRYRPVLPGIARVRAISRRFFSRYRPVSPFRTDSRRCRPMSRLLLAVSPGIAISCRFSPL